MRHEFKICIDMDGVLSDFEGRVRELIHLSKKESGKLMDEVEKENSLDKKLMWKVLHRYDEHTPFFYTLEKMSDADDLFDFVLEHFDHDSIKILTASGHTPSDAPQQKRRWIRKHYGDYHVEVVAKSPDKAQFATATTILVDDRSKSLDPWIEAGGIGILHTDAKSTIKQLQELLGLSSTEEA